MEDVVDQRGLIVSVTNNLEDESSSLSSHNSSNEYQKLEHQIDEESVEEDPLANQPIMSSDDIETSQRQDQQELEKDKKAVYQHPLFPLIGEYN